MELSTILNYFAILFFVVCWLLIIVKVMKNKYASVKTVEATVVDKYKSETVSKTPGIFNRGSYVIVFSAGKEKLAFNVSEFSFQSYRINEKGVLKYKGNKLIDFS